MTKSIRQQVVEFAIQFKSEYSWKEIAERFGLDTDTKTLKSLSDAVRYYNSTGNLVPPTAEETLNEIEKDNFVEENTSIPEGMKIKSAWQSASGKMLYSYEKEDVAENTILKTIENFKPYSIVTDEVVNKESNAGLVIFFTDAHINKLTLDGITPEQKCVKYMKLLKETIQTATKYHKLDKVVYIVGSDFFNADTYFNTTTNGTPQDNALHFDKAFELGLNLSINAIDYIKENCNNIDVIQLSGNHDQTTSFYLGKTLEAYYRNNKSITFDSAYTLRKCITLGNTSIMLHHGNFDLKYAKDMFANFFPQGYVNKFIECFTGDKHNVKIFNDGRMTIRQFPTMSTSDKWTDSKNYVNIPGILADVYDYERGHILQIDLKA